MKNRPHMFTNGILEATPLRGHANGLRHGGRPRDYFSLYCYPWDVLDERPNSFGLMAAELGLTNISVAASYHGGKALLPHNSKHHVYYIEDGAVYFRPSARYFKHTRIKPRVSRLATSRDGFRDIVETCGSNGIKTTAWTVALHNTHLGVTYPDLTSENVFGERYFHSLCPSNPDVMAYMRALAGNLASYPIDAVEFESFEFIPFRHYAFLEKEGMGVTPFANLLLSLCFCSSCVLRAKALHINTRQLTKSIKAWLQRYFEGKNRSTATEEHQISSIAGLREYLNLRFTILSQAFQEISSLLHAENKRVIPLVISQEKQLDFLTGIDLRRIGACSDAIEALFYNRQPQESGATVEAIHKAVGHGIDVYFAVRPGYPDANNVDDVIRMTKSILGSGGKGISYYNFGLLERYRMRWIGRAIRESTRKNTKLRAADETTAHTLKEIKPQFAGANVLRSAF